MGVEINEKMENVLRKNNGLKNYEWQENQRKNIPEDLTMDHISFLNLPQSHQFM